MENLLTIERTVYGISLCTARRLTAEEKTHYTPEYQELMLLGTGTSIDLPHVTWQDMPRRSYDGEFPGCSNQTWVITQEEWDAYLALEDSRRSYAEEQERQEMISRLEERKASAEAQQDLPTAEEAARRIREWIAVQNEGGEGYVPHISTREEYAEICRRLEELKGGEGK